MNTIAHDERWLDLFIRTVDESFVGDTAELAKHRATKMANALRKLWNGEDGDAGAPVEPMWMATNDYASHRWPRGDRR